MLTYIPTSPPTRRAWPARRRALAPMSLAALLVSLVACSPPSEPGVETFVCEPVGADLACVDSSTGVRVEVPWQGRAVTVSAAAVPQPYGQAGRASLSVHRTVGAFRVHDATTHAPVTTFDPPIVVEVPYVAADVAAAQPYVASGELALAVYDPLPQVWAPVGHGVLEEGYWVADPLQGGTTVLAGQPRFRIDGGAGGGSARAGLGAAPETIAVAWGSLPWNPEHVIVPIDECETVEGTLSCTFGEAGLTVRVPWQGEEVRIVALPLNTLATLTPTPFESGVIVPTRLVANFLVERAAAPGEWLEDFDPPLELELTYTDDDVAEALETPENEMFVAYWHEVEEELRALGRGDCLNCSGGTQGCVWGQEVEASSFLLLENPDDTNPEGERGGLAFVSAASWGDRVVMVGTFAR